MSSAEVALELRLDRGQLSERGSDLVGSKAVRYLLVSRYPFGRVRTFRKTHAVAM